jgi:tRNA A-37 threonylcarbamoyl transferase component Bud32
MTLRIKRIRLSFLARRTQGLLFWILGFCVISLAAIYLFLMNHLSMAGYILTVETERSKDVGTIMDKIETQIAKYETSKYIAGNPETKNMIVRQKQSFLVLKPSFTAKK